MGLCQISFAVLIWRIAALTQSVGTIAARRGEREGTTAELKDPVDIEAVVQLAHRGISTKLEVHNINPIVTSLVDKVGEVHVLEEPHRKRVQVAMGVDTGSAVQNARIPSVLKTTLNPRMPNVNLKFMILSDKGDYRLNITAIPQPNFCSTMGQQPQALPNTFVAKDVFNSGYFKGWNWRGAQSSPLTQASVAANTSRCMMYRCLYTVPLLVQKYGRDMDYYFRADDDVYVHWPGVVKAMKSLDPDVPVITGFSGGNANSCGPADNEGEFFWYGGLFGWTRAAALLFTDTIASTASEFEWYRMHGCEHQHSFSTSLPLFWKGETCDLAAQKKLAESFKICTSLIGRHVVDGVLPPEATGVLSAAGCKPYLLVKDFPTATYIYAHSSFDVNAQEDIVISFWAYKYSQSKFKLKRTSWPCFAKNREIFPDSAIQSWDPIWGLANELRSDGKKRREMIAIHHAAGYYMERADCWMAQHEKDPSLHGKDLKTLCPH
jgi:hypothetical protein